MDGESIQLFAALKRYQLCLIPNLDSNLLGLLPQLTESSVRCQRVLTYWALDWDFPLLTNQNTSRT